MNRTLRFGLCLLLTLAVILGLIAPLRTTAETAVPASTNEVRGVWLTNVASGVLFMPWGVHRALHQLAQLKFNTVYPVVWNRGYTFFPSAIAQQTTGRSQAPFLGSLHLGQDVLAEITQQGQRHHLRVIPWFEYGFMAPADSELVRRHPDWVTIRRNGSKTVGLVENEALTIPQPSQPASPAKRSPTASTVGDRVWLNPLHPQVQQFMLEMITEVVSRYAIAGVQLDDHFGLPVAFGYDDYTVGLYQAEHQEAKPPDDPTNAEWMRWRANKLSDLMARIAQTVKSVNPTCLVSLSPNPQGFSYQAYLQDWQTWVTQGWVEELVLQVYRSNLDSFQAELNQPAVRAAQQKIPVSIGILTGSWRRPIAFSQIQAQVQMARSQGFKGVSFFYWESLWGYLTPEPPRQRRANFRALFAEP